MDKYMYWLDNILYLGCPAKRRLIEVFHTPQDIYNAEEKYLKYVLDENKVGLIKGAKGNWDVDGKYEELIKRGIHMLTINEDSFPEKLRHIPDPPFCIYYLGKLPQEKIPAVAVIGARECSEYGHYIAQELGKCLGESYIQLISGMARGVDGVSQLAALEAGGTSYGIMGCGVDICYPASNRKLYDRLINEGGIISTYAPGTKPLPQLFPPRNRIVSGLSDVLVVIEARQKSGTSITVEMALEQGKEIYAVPGRVTDRLSDGCNKMLREGAHVFLSPQDFIQELYQLLSEKMEYADSLKRECKYYFSNRSKSTEDKARTVGKRKNQVIYDGTAEEKEEYDKIISVLDFYPKYVDTIAEELSQVYHLELQISRLNLLLMQLCLADQAKQVSPGWFSKSGL